MVAASPGTASRSATVPIAELLGRERSLSAPWRRHKRRFSRVGRQPVVALLVVRKRARHASAARQSAAAAIFKLGQRRARVGAACAAAVASDWELGLGGGSAADRWRLAAADAATAAPITPVCCCPRRSCSWEVGQPRRRDFQRPEAESERARRLGRWNSGDGLPEHRRGRGRPPGVDDGSAAAPVAPRGGRRLLPRGLVAVEEHAAGRREDGDVRARDGADPAVRLEALPRRVQRARSDVRGELRAPVAVLDEDCGAGRGRAASGRAR